MDRMFRVVVLGGVALAAPGAAPLPGCGGTVTAPADAGASTADSPSEPADASTDDSDACFPRETALSIDSGCGR